MRAKAIGPLLGAAAIVALLIPGAAGATPTGKHPADRASPPEVTETLEAKGTKGFGLQITLLDRRRLEVAATAFDLGRGTVLGVSYELPAPQARGSDDIVAKIGDLGRVNLTFVPESVHKGGRLPAGCSGDRSVIEEGHFVGLIAFRGERDYTEVRADRAKGEIVRQPPMTCRQATDRPKIHDPVVEKEESEADIPELEEVQLTGTAPGHGKVAFSASRLGAETKKGRKITVSSFVAAAVRHRGGIKETSLALSTVEKGSTFLSPDPAHPTAEAVIKPPFPFSGSATFRREPAEPATWSGDLKVELPGFGLVPLAGSGSRATMCASPGCPTL
jgi:hypothetical protein